MICKLKNMYAKASTTSFKLSIGCPCSLHPCVPVAQCVPYSLQYSGVCKTGTSRASNCFLLKYSFWKKISDALRLNSWSNNKIFTESRPKRNLLLNKSVFKTSVDHQFECGAKIWVDYFYCLVWKKNSWCLRPDSWRFSQTIISNPTNKKFALKI